MVQYGMRNDFIIGWAPLTVPIPSLDRAHIAGNGRKSGKSKEGNKMRMLLVGAGAVGESILKVLKKRDPKGEWLEFVLVGDCRPERARKVAAGLRDTAEAGDASGQRESEEPVRPPAACAKQPRPPS